MCKAPKAPKVKIDDPQYLRNPFLDAERSGAALVDSLRIGRSSLRIPLDTGLGVGFSQGSRVTGTGATGSPGYTGAAPGRSSGSPLTINSGSRPAGGYTSTVLNNKSLAL